MIELVSEARCIGCAKCIQVCPTDVFDAAPDGVPIITRQSDCQTCFMCEAYCPVDALFVAPQREPLPPGHRLGTEGHLVEQGLLGSYRARLGWGRGRSPGAAVAVGPRLRSADGDRRPTGPPLV